MHCAHNEKPSHDIRCSGFDVLPCTNALRFGLINVQIDELILILTRWTLRLFRHAQFSRTKLPPPPPDIPETKDEGQTRAEKATREYHTETWNYVYNSLAWDYGSWDYKNNPDPPRATESLQNEATGVLLLKNDRGNCFATTLVFTLVALGERWGDAWPESGHVTPHARGLFDLVSLVLKRNSGTLAVPMGWEVRTAFLAT